MNRDFVSAWKHKLSGASALYPVLAMVVRGARDLLVTTMESYAGRVLVGDEVSLGKTYSARNAVTGSIRDARRAGK
jgi:hypothetical protein